MTARPLHQLSPEVAGIGMVFHNECGHVVEANSIAQSILGLTSPLPTGKESEAPYWRLVGDGAAKALPPLPVNHVNGDVVSIHTHQVDVRHLKIGVHSCKHTGDEGFVVSLIDLTETLCECNWHAADIAPHDYLNPVDTSDLVQQLVSADDPSYGASGHRQIETGFVRGVKCRADRDPLTGTGNRLAFLGQLGAALRGESRTRASAGAVVLIDIHRFGGINDTLGHDAGDELLRIIAVRLGRVLRESDMIARICGGEFALDDFGTGFASLAHLRQFRIDRSFVTGLPNNAEDTAIVRAMIDLAHDLGMDVVAEGIETPQHLAFLTAQHCDVGQGYLFSRPESLERILETWAERNHKRQDAG